MARTGTCDNCGRSVTITTDRGEYVVRGLRGYEFSDGTIYCEHYKTLGDCPAQP